MVFMEKVQIVIEGLIKNSNSIRNATKNINQLAIGHKNLNRVIANPKLKTQAALIKRYGKQLDSFRGVMSMTLPQFQAFNNVGGKMQTMMGRAGVRVRKATAGMKGFRMELLGVMFFGMMVTNFFKGLLRPAMEAFGVMELWTAMLTVLFLPIMELLFPLFLKFITFFLDLPDSVKLVIGVFTVLAVVVGTLIFLIGSIGLGIGSMIIAFGTTFGVIASFAGIFLAVFVGIGLIVSRFV